MSDHRANAKWVFVVLAILLCSTSRAAEVTWITGNAVPATWSIQPGDPNQTDVIRFCGPTRSYLNPTVAERSLGGRPVLHIDVAGKQIQLAFEPSATQHRTSLWNPVRGLQGSFGPLGAGTWHFFCIHSGLVFSLPFEVRGEASRNVYYVDRRATGAKNGLSWAHAFVDVPSALAAAGPGSEIRVAKGVYRPSAGDGAQTEDPNATFLLKNGVILKGGYAGLGAPRPDERDIARHETVLSGDLLGNDDLLVRPRGIAGRPDRADNSFHVVTASQTDSTAVLDGFTITGGCASGAQEPHKSTYGGGIYIEAASPVIRNCLIAGNAARYYGGGVYTRGQCAPALIESAIADNWSGARGGGLYKDWGTDVRLDRCLISGNGALIDGGGLSNHTDSSLTLSNCVVSGNVAAMPQSGRGGGLFCSLATAHLRHCTFVGNSAAQGASVACDSLGQPGKGEVHLRNCILWDLGESIWNRDESIVEVLYSDVQGGWSGLGNISFDPKFMDAGLWDLGELPDDPCDDTWSDGDYRLAWDSPCIDGGDPCSVADVNALDFAGGPRLSGLRIDMGAYELRNDPPTADAGPDVSGYVLTGATGTVTLDASRSADPQGRPLSYSWYRDGQLVSSQAQLTVELPLGEHVFTLIVNDGMFDSPPDEVCATISLPVAAQVLVAPIEIERWKTDKPVFAVAVLPKGRRPVDFDNTWPVLLYPGGAKAATQTAFIWFGGNTLVLARFNRMDLTAHIPNDGPVPLRLLGRLRDGTYFTGVDTVTIR